MPSFNADNKRIARNTILLYFRTILIMLVSIYTSRVVLKALGVEDYGIYNAVGGVIAMFSVISGALSNAISRYITFGLGKGDINDLKKIFFTSVAIQVLISLLIILLAEAVGVWFLNNKMSIPSERLFAANWVLQFSLLAFVLNLISIPYNACIIAHEKMDAFAYISIVDAALKLSVAFLIAFFQFDRLILFAGLNVVVALVVRLLYGVYCKRHFEEAKFKIVYDKGVFKDMLGFAGWSFLTHGAYVFNNQGVNILINVFFGVTLNAARGLANQIENAIMTLVGNFTTALSPQITKSYAVGDKERNFYLICKGAKFSCYLLLIFSLPFIFETEFILKLWLGEVPEYTALFLRLSFLGAIVTCIGKTGTTACMATGDIKKYTIVLTSVGVLAFVLTLVAYHFGAPVEACYIIFAAVYVLVEVVRLYMMKVMLGFPPSLFVKDVLFYLLKVSIVIIIAPLAVLFLMEPGLLRFVVSVLVCISSSCAGIYFLGLTKGEQAQIKDRLNRIIASKRI